MNKEILLVVDAVSNEKGVEKEIIFEAIEAALASATRKRYGEDIDVRVAIDRESGDYETFRRWLVFADDSTELEFPEHELRMQDAVEYNPDVQPGEYVEEPMESVAFGRIAAQTAKQVFGQILREAAGELGPPRCMPVCRDQVQRKTAARDAASLPDPCLVEADEVRILTVERQQQRLSTLQLGLERIGQGEEIVLHQSPPPNTSTPRNTQGGEAWPT